MRHHNISVVIPTYKKEKQLLTNLQHNLPFLKGCEVIVVNDNPHASIVQLLKDNELQDVILLENSTNLGFAGAVNTGIMESTKDYIFLLNSDVLLKDTKFINALQRFQEDTQLFAISFAQEEKKGKVVGKNTLFWEQGMIMHSGMQSSESGYTAWAEGGSSIFDKQKLIGLGAFDTIYSPFYWEDIDLSYRAWKEGYTVYFDASILVEHHHESTIGSYFNTYQITETAFRNQLFFIWKNITDSNLTIQHVMRLPIHILKYVVKGEFALVGGFFRACKQMLMATDKRQKSKLSDFYVLELFKNHRKM